MVVTIFTNYSLTHQHQTSRQPVRLDSLRESLLSSPPAVPATTLKISGLLTAKEDPPHTKATKVKGGGLAHGTGRIRPAIINRSDSAASKNRSSPPSQQPPLPHPSKPAPQPKLCTVIDQGPIPLYCSDECRLKDLSRLDGALSIDYNPNSASTPLTASISQFFLPKYCKSEDESNGFVSFSLDSRSSSSDSGPVSPSLTTLSAIYRFPPLPPAPPILPTSAKPSPPEPQHLHNYQSGVMMSAKHIQAALCAPQSTKRPWLNEPQPPCKPIPGWTDGSQDWHESIYSFSPRSSSIVAPGLETKPCPVAASNEADQLDVKVLPLSRCPESRTSSFTPSMSCPSQSLPPLSPSSTTLTSTSTRCRRDNLLAKVGGRLLVPNVTVPPHHSSSQSMSSCISSPLSRYPSKVSEDSMLNEERSSSDSVPSQPSVSVHSWSYNNVRGEVEAEVGPQVKHPFLFAGKEAGCEQWQC
ncbi:hypothetical protein EDD16DRAFT_1770972 [Pisolithus croceorrhizus]|nr:hypothetical protein EDD16DRAFT_1770972 [Pisolithus croceorrhizus]